MTEISLPTTQAESGVNKQTRVRTMGRSIGVFGAVAFGVGCISLSASGMIPFSVMAGAFPGVNLTWIVTIAMLICLFRAYTFGVIGSAAPNSGADYVFSSRVLGAPLGFAASWTVVFFSAWVAGSLVALIPQSVLPMLMQILGVIYSQDNMISLARQVSTTEGIILVGSICIVLAFILTILPARVIQRLMVIGLVLVLIAWGVIFFQIATAPNGSFPAAWDSFMGQGNYTQQLAQANQLGMTLPNDPSLMVIAALMMGFWMFFGHNISTHFAGEVKQPGKTLLAGSWISLIVTWAVFVIATYLLQRLVPNEWLSAESYLYQSHIEGVTMPWIIFYGAILRPNILLVLLVALAWVFTLINLVQSYFFYCSRILFAWARDQIMPEGMTYIHPDLRSPLIPVLIVAIVSLAGLIQAAQGGIYSSLLSFIFVAICAQLVPVLAAILFPFLKKNWFESSGPLVRLKIGPVPVITLVGAITFLCMLALVVLSLLFPIPFGPMFSTNLIILATLLLSGAAWFYWRLWFLKKRGVNLSEQLKNIPEE